MRASVKKAKIAAVATGKTISVLTGLALGTVVLGCSSSGNGQGGSGGTGGKGGQSGAGNSPTTTESITINRRAVPQVDILFVLDDESSSSEIKGKLYAQLPLFVNVLQSLPTPLDLHVAVTSADMGLPSDVMAALNSTAQGDNGAFLSAPTQPCTSTTLMNGATFLADDGNGTANFTDPMAKVLQCISMIGDHGPGMIQPLAAAARALGADNVVNGTPTPPATNVGFLRPDAYLAIIFLAERDDCSVPAGTELFSLNGGEQNLANPLGPIAPYRCNRYGHLCKDPASSNPQALIMPPLAPPADAQGTASNPTLDLTDCQDNDQGTGMLIPVSTLVSQIKALKPDPEHQIIVSSISGPPTPYAVAWFPTTGGQNTQPGELWPLVEYTCGAAGETYVNPEATMHPTDGSAAEPGVRLAAFVNGFSNSVLASVCDTSYASVAQAIATKVGQLPSMGSCLTGTIQSTVAGLPNCTAVAQVPTATGTKGVPYPSCETNGNAAPCWMLNTGGASCVGSTVNVLEDSTSPSSSITVSCQICQPGASVSGCP